MQHKKFSPNEQIPYRLVPGSTALMRYVRATGDGPHITVIDGVRS